MSELPPERLPFVSVLMPIRNEGAYIERSLRAVLAQDYPHDRMEILIADGMSTDDTREIVRRFQKSHASIRLIDNPGRIVPTGLNAAIAQSRGEILVRVDGHCEIAPDYVRHCVRHLLEDGVEAVGGPLETLGETPMAKLIARAMSSRFGVGGSAFRTVSDRTMLVDTVAFPAYLRSVVERAGPFDEELVRNQDDEYNYRLRKLGAKVLLAADIRSRYYSRSGIRALWRQYFQYGYWKVRVMQKHPRQMRPRQFVAPAFAGSLVGAAMLAPFSVTGQALLASVAGAYGLANLAASVRTAAGIPGRQALLLPAVFATLHLSYGLGFLVGLVRFWNRWGDKRTQSRAMTDPGSPAHSDARERPA